VTSSAFVRGGAAGVENDDVHAAEAFDCRRDKPLEVVCVRDVAGDGNAADAHRLALEHVLAAGEHDDVRSRLGERLRTAEADPCRRAADDCRTPAEAKVHI
jgi:hypothetical protein